MIDRSFGHSDALLQESPLGVGEECTNPASFEEMASKLCGRTEKMNLTHSKKTTAGDHPLSVLEGRH